MNKFRAVGALLGLSLALVFAVPVAAASPGSVACADVLLLAVPGTNETNAGADPAESRGLLAQVTDPLEGQYSAARVRVYFVPYPASVRDPLYPTSVWRGVQRTSEVLARTSSRCPGTEFVLLGYSQGADVAGDVAARIGHHGGPVAPAAVAFVALVGGPQYDSSAAATVGSVDGGVGVLGGRPDGYGALRDRVVQVCAEGDWVCDPPQGGYSSLQQLREAMHNGRHTSYPALVVDGGGTTALEFLTAAAGWAIENSA